jgi:hypothetical protein
MYDAFEASAEPSEGSVVEIEPALPKAAGSIRSRLEHMGLYQRSASARAFSSPVDSSLHVSGIPDRR